MDDLTERQRELLDFERRRFRYAGSRDTAILERFGVSATLHAQELNALIDLPAALAYDPVTTNRLRRLRESRRRMRTEPGVRLRRSRDTAPQGAASSCP